jgi:hypothetical protein
MITLDHADPIWGAMPATVNQDGDALEVDCARAGGRYRISGTALAALKPLSPDERARLTRLIADANRLEGVRPEVSSETVSRARAMPDLTVAQRMDRFMAYLARSGSRPGRRLDWMGAHQVTPQTEKAKQAALAAIDAVEDGELAAFRALLEGVGLLSTDGNAITVTAAGYARMDELARGVIATDQVFVAMWFADEMAAAYAEGIEAAVRETGLSPMRIDRKEHDNKIDDEIVAEIRRSRLVICDFTCGTAETSNGKVAVPRGGVYYEAGFAQGLGIPVIWCVRHDQIDQVHFDTRQFNHIVWKDPEDLRRRLVNRVRARFADAG